MWARVMEVGDCVAPRVGAGIEINSVPLPFSMLCVAPRVGTGIEILCATFGRCASCVAPRVGAGIEIAPSRIALSAA